MFEAISETDSPEKVVRSIQHFSRLVASLNAEVTAILAEPETIDRVKKIGGEPKPTSAEAFRTRVSSDIAKWTKVVADAGIARI